MCVCVCVCVCVINAILLSKITTTQHTLCGTLECQGDNMFKQCDYWVSQQYNPNLTSNLTSNLLFREFHRFMLVGIQLTTNACDMSFMWKSEIQRPSSITLT